MAAIEEDKSPEPNGSAIKKLQKHFDRSSVIYFIGLIFAMGIFTGTKNTTDSDQDKNIILHEVRITKVEGNHATDLVEPARNDEKLKSQEKKNNEQDDAIKQIIGDVAFTKGITIETQSMVIEMYEKQTGKKYHAIAR